MTSDFTDDAVRLLERHLRRTHESTDRMFARLLAIEWGALIALAVWTTPYAWIGDRHVVHPHVWLATLLGAIIVVPALWLIRRLPGSNLSRHAVAISQSLVSVLLIHLSGGRIESHFHVFGSLAFLSFYRDWRILATATVVTGIDHAVLGLYLPESVFGVGETDPWRWLEHVAWVLYEDFFLIAACRRSLTEMIEIAKREAESISSAQRLDSIVQQRTAELRENEADLRISRDRAQAANVAKSEFLANMSHEIRTPMTAILGYADLLFETGDMSRAPVERIEAIETIRRNGHHLLALLNDLLDLSRIESGMLAVEHIACSPSNILQEVEHLLRVRAVDKRIRLEVRTEGAVPETIVGDPTRIRQIIVNLLGNAIKFTEQGGVAVVARFASGPQPIMEVDITDSGIGMTPDQQARIFEPFVQADCSTARRFGGSGLGLVISRRLASLLGGEVSLVFSEAGVGTCFRLRLPVNFGATTIRPNDVEAKVPVVEARRQCGPTLAGLRLLVAEDGRDNQRLIMHYLNRAGALTTLVENGLEAVDAAVKLVDEASPFDAILMDMQMPEMDGYAATRKLRQLGYDGRIIALTAHAMSSDRKQCLDAGCDDYITKPIDRKQLVAMLEPLTRGHATETERRNLQATQKSSRIARRM